MLWIGDNHASAQRRAAVVAHSGCLRHAAVALGAIDVRHVPGLSMDFLGCVLLEKKPNGDWVHLAGEFAKHVPER